jgi:hypothetical protein
MEVVYAIVRKDGKALNVTSQNMTVRYQIALDMGSVLLAYVCVIQVGMALSVSKVSASTSSFCDSFP